MHISEGILDPAVLGAGFAATAAIAAITMRNMDIEEVPKVSVVTAVFFVASLLRVPSLVPGVSIHLMLIGLAGIVLGWRGFVAVMLGIILQAIIFGHGGVTVIGVNSLMLGGGALVAYGIWQLRHFTSFKKKELIFGALAGSMATLFSGTVLALTLMTKGEAFMINAKIILYTHIPIMLIEGVIAGVCADFLKKVKPDILSGNEPRAGH